MRTFTLSVNHSVAEVLRLSRFLRRRIQHRPECSGLTATLNLAIQNLEAAQARRDELHECRTALSAELSYLDEVVDAAVAGFVRHLLAHLGGNRQHPSFQRLFPTAPSEAMAGVATAEQVAYVDAMLQAFERDSALLPLSGHVIPVQSAQDAVKRARAERDAATAQTITGDGDLSAFKQALITAYNNAHHELHILYPGEKGLIRSFYYDARLEKEEAA